MWTVYHALDSDVADPFQAYLATSYIDREIPHIPVVTSDDVLAADAVLPVNAGPYAHWQEQVDGQRVLPSMPESMPLWPLPTGCRIHGALTM